MIRLSVLRRWAAAAFAVLMAPSCARQPWNPPLAMADPDHGYRYRNLPHPNNSDEVFVCLTFSGGGGRAAALSYGVLEQLRDTEIEVEGQRRRLLDEVDVISSVSGGSFTAAYFALHGDEIFTTYEDRFLHRNFQRRIVLSALNPLQWPRYLSPSFSVTDRAEEIYDRGLYGGATYADLEQRGRPFIIINATDVTLGQPFQFTQDQFDFLQSDLSGVRVARAVTASSAVPVALSPIGLRVYHEQPNWVLPEWITQELASSEFSSMDWQQANQLTYYTRPEQSQYVHLVDGGITDNLGVRPVLSAPRRSQNDLSVRQMVNLDRAKHVLLIMVNAANQPDSDWTRRAHPPGALAVLNKSIGGLMSNTSASMSRSVEERLMTAQQRNQGTSITLVEIGFSDLPEQERGYFLNIATSLGLSTETYDRLIDTGARLLAESPEYQQFVTALGGTVTPVHPTTE